MTERIEQPQAPQKAEGKTSIGVRVYDPPQMPVQGKGRILLLKLDHIGDFIVAIEAFRILRRAFRDAEITLVCLPAIVALAESTGLFDLVIGFAAEPDSEQLGKIEPLSAQDQEAAFRALPGGRYHLAADFKYDGTTRKWLDRVDAGIRAGFGAPTIHGLDILLPDMEWDVAPANLGGKNLPAHAEMRLTMLAHLIVDSLIDKTVENDFFTPAPEWIAAPEYQRLAADARVKASVSLGAGSELRQWPAPYWLKLLARLTEEGIAPVFFGGAHDREATAVLTAQLPAGSFIDLTGGPPLAALPLYMRALDCYIGCDTGLTHLAGRIGLPTINLFAGVSTLSVWRVRGSRVKTLYAEVKCAPCHLRHREDCPNGQICMKAILPEMAYACFEQLVASRKRPQNA